MNDAPRSSGERLLTFGSGGWALVLAAVVTFGLTFWALAPAMFGPPRPPGNGRDIETFEFDLTGLNVDRAYVVPAMHHRDIIQPMDEPIILEGQTIAALNEERRKYLVPLEEIIGVVVNGEARAYPISVLNVHEVIHDELGGRPIAVTWHWPCGSIVVFDRAVNGRVLEFGVSGAATTPSAASRCGARCSVAPCRDRRPPPAKR